MRDCVINPMWSRVRAEVLQPALQSRIPSGPCDGFLLERTSGPRESVSYESRPSSSMEVLSY